MRFDYVTPYLQAATGATSEVSASAARSRLSRLLQMLDAAGPEGVPIAVLGAGSGLDGGRVHLILRELAEIGYVTVDEEGSKAKATTNSLAQLVDSA